MEYLTRGMILKCLILIIYLLSPIHSSAQDESNDRVRKERLLVINALNEMAPWSQSFIAPILTEGAQSGKYITTVTNMNSTFITNDTIYQRTVNGILNSFGSSIPDGIVLLGDAAFTLIDRIVEEWGSVPMLLIGNTDKVGEPAYYFTGSHGIDADEELTSLSDMREKFHYNMSYIESPIMFRETIDLMIYMNPDMEKIVFAADELWANRNLNRSIRSYIQSHYPGISYEWLVGKSSNSRRLVDYLMSTNRKMGFLFSSWFYAETDVNGWPSLVMGDFKSINQAEHAVYALREAYLTSGVIGGFYPDETKTRQALIEAIQTMVNTGNLSNHPFYYPEFPADFHNVINYPQLISDGYTQKDCPEDTVFINYTGSSIKDYIWLIAPGAILIIALIAFILINYYMQKMRNRLYSSRETMLRNMPIAFADGKARLNSDGDVVEINYHETNAIFENVMPIENHRTIITDDSHRKLINSVVKEGKSVTLPLYFPENDSYYDFVITPGTDPCAIQAFGINTTKIRRAEAEVRESRKQLAMTLNVAHIIPWQWDIKAQRIFCESRRSNKLLNNDFFDTNNRSVTMIDCNEYLRRIHPDDIAGVRQSYRDLIEKRKKFVKQEFRYITRKNGATHIDWVEVNATIDHSDERGTPISLTGSLLIITERKKQENSIIIAKEHATESDRLKSAFLANMSHEIRTPLNAIVGFSNLLAHTDDPAKKEQFMGIIENNNQLLLQLISDILDLAKVEANTLEFIYRPTDLNDLIRKIENTIKMRVKPGVMLNYTLGATKCVVETERNRLSQVLINMLTNATKFTDRGSITFGYELRGEEIYFFVRDTGIGISPEKQKNVFQRFTKLNNFAQGSGLGLSISQSIIKKMGGRIGVESPGTGLGSTFWFTIPFIEVKADQERKVNAEPIEKSKIEKEKLTLLIAEDNESNYLLFDTILSNDYNLIHAWDGVEAVELFKQHKPDMIVMDINMPNMDGYEATREIRKLSRTVPITAVTAYAFASDKEKIMENGFNGYVSKPVNAAKLKSELKKMVDNLFIML
ncbi:MAG: response regulator [Bacteroides sp.]|nr:response regulator [Bacteroides sp.]MCM1389890.1 response regulator [Bacteroides sp.]